MVVEYLVKFISQTDGRRALGQVHWWSRWLASTWWSSLVKQVVREHLKFIGETGRQGAQMDNVQTNQTKVKSNWNHWTWLASLTDLLKKKLQLTCSRRDCGACPEQHKTDVPSVAVSTSLRQVLGHPGPSGPLAAARQCSEGKAARAFSGCSVFFALWQITGGFLLCCFCFYASLTPLAKIWVGLPR